MYRSLLLSLVVASAFVFALDKANANPPIYTPVTGTWLATQAGMPQAIAFTFQPGDSYNPQGSACGNGIGNGAQFRFAFGMTGPDTGRLKMLMAGGEVEFFVTFQNSGKVMTWQSGGQTLSLARLN